MASAGTTDSTQDDHTEIVSVIAPLQRYVRSRVASSQDADDIVQETLARVIAARHRLDSGVALAYSIVVARHVMIDLSAKTDQARQSRHRLIERTEPQRPDDELVRREEKQALTAALAVVPTAERQRLLAHVLDDEPVSTLATSAGTSSGSVAAQLARTRARLRLDYVLAMRGVELPTARCRPILLALSAGDMRRQRALRADQHLLSCPTCSEVSEPLLRRRSGLAAILPWLGIGPVAELLRRILRSTPRSVGVAAGSAAAVTLTAAAVAGAAMVAPRPAAPSRATAAAPSVSPSPSAAPSPSASPAATPGHLVRLADGADLLASPALMAGTGGARVEANAVPVQAVVADEGFWIGRGTADRVFVQLIHTGKESPMTVKQTDVVSFVGVVTRHGAGFAQGAGVTAVEGAGLLTREGAHLTVNERQITVQPAH